MSTLSRGGISISPLAPYHGVLPKHKNINDVNSSDYEIKAVAVA